MQRDDAISILDFGAQFARLVARRGLLVLLVVLTWAGASAATVSAQSGSRLFDDEVDGESSVSPSPDRTDRDQTEPSDDRDADESNEADDDANPEPPQQEPEPGPKPEDRHARPPDRRVAEPDAGAAKGPAQGPAQARAKRLAPPRKQAAEDALARVKAVFEEDYAREEPADRIALAKNFIQLAQETADDPPARYVLLSEARRLAAAAGDVRLAYEAIDQQALVFKVNVRRARLAALAGAVEAKGERAEKAAVADACLALSDELLAADDFARAEKAATLAGTAARQSKSRALRVRSGDQLRRVRHLRRERGLAEAAEKTLRDDPDNPEANLALGRYLCFGRGDWAAGLPCLAKGSDPVLKNLADLELSVPAAAIIGGENGAVKVVANVNAGAKAKAKANADEVGDAANAAANAADAQAIADLADAWWDVGAKAPKDDAPAFRARAAEWYAKAIPGLAGIRKLAAEKRLAEGLVIPFGRIAAAVRDGRVARTPRSGGGGGGPFETTCEGGGLLTGFVVTQGHFAGHTIVGSVTPIYLTAAGREVGQRVGPGGSNETVVEAKPGYAVGGLVARGGHRFDGFRVVFMRLRPGGLDTLDRYESDWVCGTGGGESVLGCDGRFVIGIHGGTGLEFDGMGLVQME